MIAISGEVSSGDFIMFVGMPLPIRRVFSTMNIKFKETDISKVILVSELYLFPFIWSTSLPLSCFRFQSSMQPSGS